MSDGSAIEWTDATWNPITGCSVHSAGCTNCYAMQLAGTRLKHHASRAGLTREVNGNHVWTGDVRFNDEWLTQPLKWRRPRMIFVCAHADLFHENVPDEWIDRVFAVMALAPQHRFQVLTKRAERMRAYAASGRTPGRIARGIIDLLIAGQIAHREPWPVRSIGDIDDPEEVTVAWPLPNVWLGVSVEDQRAANERIPHLLETPAAVRFLSCEPLLGPIDLTWIEFLNERGGAECYDALDLHGMPEDVPGCRALIDWVIVGGESGDGARPMHPDWARSLRDQCTSAGVPFFFKQWGAFAPSGPAARAVDYLDCAGAVAWPDGTVTRQGGDPAKRGGAGLYMYRAAKSVAGRLLDGVQHDGMPA